MKFCSNVFSRGGKILGRVLLGIWFSAVAEGATYFVNDLSTTGDVYTAAIGSDANSGTSSNAPKLTLTNLLANASLQPGDIVYIDTGVYSNYTVTISSTGSLGSPIVFQGSPTEGGTVINRNASNQNVFNLAGANNLEFRDMTITGGSAVFPINAPSSRFNLERVWIRDNNGQVFGRGQWLLKSSVIARNSGVVIGGGGALLSGENSIFWRNGNVVTLSADGRFTNCVFAGALVRQLDANSISGDYNVYWDTIIHPGFYLHELKQPNSTYADPLFVDSSNLNFQSKSVAGRLDEQTGTIVTDLVHSILIDFGDPANAAWTNEPGDKGGRINAGIYGGTSRASRSRTNAWLQVLSYNDGGSLSGTSNALQWSSGNLNATSTVKLLYQKDTNAVWEAIESGIPATNRVYFWSVTNLSAFAGRWRVELDADSSVYSESYQRFSVNGARVYYYINNTEQTGDYYTSVPGDDQNSGVATNQPRLTFTSLFSSYALGRNDTVLIDAGTYSNTVAVRHYGTATQKLTFQGVPQFDRTIFTGPGAAFDVRGNYIQFRDFTVTKTTGNASFDGLNILGLEMDGLRVISNNVNGVIGRSIWTLRRSVVAFNSRVGSGAGSGIDLAENCVFWGNTVFHDLGGVGGAMVFRNCVLGNGQLNAFPDSFFVSDHNILQNFKVGNYANMLELQGAAATKGGGWLNSAVLDPLFADPASGNFFPKSLTGRYNPSSGQHDLVDPVHSPLIDFGDPASTLWTNESAPNGGRLNAGAYGGTALASKSRTNRWLQVLSLTDGGSLSAPENDIPVSTVRWLASTNYAPGAYTVRIELSRDGGASWDIVATGIDGSTGAYLWVNTNFSSSFNSLWRVTDEASTNIASQTEVPFTFRNGAFEYFINNNSTNGNVYTTAVGLPGNSGSTPSSPKDSLTGLLSSLQAAGRTLLPGDKIYIDTGTYTLTNTISVSAIHSGQAGVPVLIIGSTNEVAGGTVFNRNSTSSDGMVLSANYWQINDLSIRNARTGLIITNSVGSELVRVQSYSHQEDGIRLEGTSGEVVLHRSVVRNNGRDGIRLEGSGCSVAIQHSVFWSNTNVALRVNAGSATITNSALAAFGLRAAGYHATATNSILGNFNNVHAASNAVVGFIASLGRNADTIASWQRLTGQESRSLGVEPKFVNAGAGNFRLSAGSDLIDQGDRNDDFAMEPLPNGGQVNIGLYGGTSEAEVGALGARLLTVSPRDGGWMAGTNEFRWAAYDVAPSATVAIDLSTDGSSWSNLAAGVSATNEVFAWDSTVVADTPAARWRVTLEGNPNVKDESGSFFAIRNGGVLGIYVNDGNGAGDVFTSAAGSATNWMATSNAPLNLLSRALALYDLEPGDAVYVDTGVYNETNVVAARRVSGSAVSPIRIVGASDEVAGGARIDRGSSSTNAFGIEFQAAAWNSISNITVSSAYQGLRLVQADNNRFAMVRVISNAQHGVFSTGSTNNSFVNLLSAFNGGAGYRGEASSSASWVNSVVWSNAAGAMAQSGGLLSVTNSVLMAYGSGQAVYDASTTNLVRSDFNNLVVGDGAISARVGANVYGAPIQWQVATSNDLRSLSHDPKFANAAVGDFHPQSPFGRFVVGSGYVTNGSDGISPLIDTGNPASSFANEPIPNGGRINIGLYGNTSQSSKSDSNGFLLALTLNSGGTVRGTNTFYWTAGGPVTGHTVWVQFSRDGGATWSNVASVAASAGSFTLNTATIGTGTEPLSRWRVQSQTDTNILGATESTFVINNGPLTFYVNDASTNGNVYTTAAGSPANSGTDTNSPLDSIQSVIQRYGTRPGDRIFVDTGVYTNFAEILFTSQQSGTATGRVQIIGSTNFAAGGTKLVRSGSGRAINIEGSTNLTMRFFTIEHQGTGVRVASQANGVELEWVNVAGGQHGFEVDTSPNTVIRNSSVRNGTGSGVLLSGSTTGFRLLNSVLWSNLYGVNQSAAGSVASISNSVIGVFATNGLAIRKISDTTATTANFNNYVLQNGALMAGIDFAAATSRDFYYRSVSRWARATGVDRQSLSHDPRFVDPEVGDFRLKSAAGHALFEGGFSSGDVITSPLIDAGDPGIVATNELAPNGGRIDIGQYGNSRWASATPTNGWLTVVSLNDGGRIEGTTNIFWLAGGAATNHVLRVEYSANDGASWSTITNGIFASAGQVTWNTTLFASSVRGRLRITSTNDPSVMATNAINFAVRNVPIQFFVNDGWSTNDVYTTEAGQSGADGLSSNTPLDSIQAVLDRYEVDGGDIIYVDSGLYHQPTGLGLNFFASGTGAESLVLQGSTNVLAGGTTLTADSGNPVVRLDSAAHATMRWFNIHPAGGAAGVRFRTNADSNRMEFVRVSGGANGFDFDTSAGNVILNSSVRNATGAGVLVGSQSPGTRIAHSVLWKNLYGVNLSVATAGAEVRNSVIGVDGSGRYAYRVTAGAALTADYNNLFLTNSARAGLVPTSPVATFYSTLSRWTAETGRDRFSLSHDPRFLNPENGDFRLMSAAGHAIYDGGFSAPDATTSALIDAGDPAGGTGNEIEPNGGRVNIGMLGGTEFAGKSPSSPELLIGSLNDGGVTRGVVDLVWVARGSATGHTVTVEVSIDGGDQWTVLATNVAAGSSALSWNTLLTNSTPIGMWRVTSETEPSISVTSQIFTVRNGPINYYVNDGSTTGDVYTAVAGSASANGAFSNSPMDSIAAVLARYDLEPGDNIFVDTGLYSDSVTIVIGEEDAGVNIFGSTNTVHGGTQLAFADGATTGISISSATNVSLSHLRFDAVTTAISLSSANNAVISGVDISGNGSGTGISISSSPGTQVRNSSVRGKSNGISISSANNVALSHVVLWSNVTAGVDFNSSTISLQNSVLGVMGGINRVGIKRGTSGSIQSDYNLFDIRDGGLMAEYALTSPLSLQWDRVATWSRDMTNDFYSLSGDPGFADAESGNFYPLSAAGRYNPVTGGFTNDAVTSVLIDAGNPASSFANETGPNGGRVNIGMHGNTARASRSPAEARLTIARLNDGGRAEGSAYNLTWVAAGAATGHAMRVEASLDDGATWLTINSNVSAGAQNIFWNTGTNAAWLGRWKVTSLADTNVFATNAIRFAARNAPLSLFVNDEYDPANDIYTTAAGAATNTGTRASAPRDGLQSLLDEYDLEPGDTIYIDTGSYTLTQAVTVGRFDAWNAFNNFTPLVAGGTGVRIIGSTNDAAGGSQFIRSGSGAVLDLQNAAGLHVSHLRLSGGSTAVSTFNSPNLLLEWLDIQQNATGISIGNNSQGARMRHLLMRGSTAAAIDITQSTGHSLSQSVLWSNRVGLSVASAGSVTARNSAFVGVASGSSAYRRNDQQAGTLATDYNLIYALPEAYLVEVTGNQYPGGARLFGDLASWQAFSGLDSNSFYADPLFADALAGDFHPQSPFGRFVVGSGYETNIGDGLSPLIDAGDPAVAVGSEPAANGGRANIGLYGTTELASKSPANGLLQVLTFNDGGSAAGTIPLRWVASGAQTSGVVTLSYSFDGGTTWSVIASNVAASAGVFNWDSTAAGSYPGVLWQVSSTTYTSTVEQTFALRNGGGFTYYVAVDGDDAATGYSPPEAKLTLQRLLDDIDLEPGDVVQFGAGTYAVAGTTTMSEFDSGVSNNPVILRGSSTGATIIARSGGLNAPVLLLDKAVGVKIEDLEVRGGSFGISLQFADDAVIERVTVRDTTASGAGIRVAGSRRVVIQNSLLVSNALAGVYLEQLSAIGQTPGDARLLNNTIWGNRYGVNVGQGGAPRLTNNLIYASGAASRIYYFAAGQRNVVADRNAYHREDGALMSERLISGVESVLFQRLLDWQRDTTNDVLTLTHDPLVVNAGAGDFRLTASSPLVDAGLGTSANEPLSFGGVRAIDIGRDGATTNGLARTNAWLLALSYNDGADLEGTNLLYWAAGGWTNPASTVKLEFADDGVNYNRTIATGVPVSQGSVTWDVSGFPPIAAGRWRVVSEEDAGVVSAIEGTVAVKNEPLVIYVNDAYDAGSDIYTTAEGLPENSGLTNSAPLHSLAVAIEKYPLGPGDTIYVDTGVYSITNVTGLRIGAFDDFTRKGASNFPIRIIGSTNVAAGGSVINGRVSSGYGLRIFGSEHIEISDLQFPNVATGVVVEASDDITLRGVESYNNQIGFVFNNSRRTRLEQSAAWNNSVVGVSMLGSLSGVSAALRHTVIWENAVAGIRQAAGALTVSNSIVGATSAASGLVYDLTGGSLGADYNVYWTGASTNVAKFNTTIYSTLQRWQAGRNTDHNSVRVDPLFADAAGGDFHLRSEAGRWDVAAQEFVLTDTNTSWAIDAGAPGDAFGLETDPNGGRVNAGRYGNTAEASLSVTNNRALFAATLRDGVEVAGSQRLVWLARGLASNATVRLEYTLDNGLSWLVIATNVPASDFAYTWDTEGLDATPLGRWRIVLEGEEAVSDETVTPFYVRNAPIHYYVNDAYDPLNDIYTTAAGHDANDGVSPARPVASVAEIFNRYELRQGDTLYIDTGVYDVPANVVVAAKHFGTATNRVRVLGSTNKAAGGTVLGRSGGGAFTAGSTEALFEVIGAKHIEFADLVITNANAGVWVRNITPATDVNNLLFRTIEIRDGGYYGVRLAGSGSNRLERVLVHRMSGFGMHVTNSANTEVESSVFWANALGAVSAGSSSLRMTNSVLHAFGGAGSAALRLEGATAVADYNNYVVEGESPYVIRAGEPFVGLPQYTRFTTQDVHSLSVDPGFADPANNDFHVRSATGRWDPATNDFVTGDAETSWMIDTGDPAAGVGNEPGPNGGRRNIGLYGGTTQASKSRTNAWLLAITGMNGGRLSAKTGAIPLRWAYGNLDATNTVAIEYMTNESGTWLPVASGLSIADGGYGWSTNVIYPVARWRVVLEANTNVAGATFSTFGLNGPFTFYVNDDSTDGDVFTGAVGNDANTGLSSNEPMATLSVLLNTYDLDPEDEVWIDTGVYAFTTNNLARILRDNRGAQDLPVVILGSPAGTVWSGGGLTVLTVDAPYVVVSNVVLQAANVSVLSTNVVLQSLVATNSTVTLAAGSALNTVEGFRLSGGGITLAGNDGMVRRGRMSNSVVTISGARGSMTNVIMQGGSPQVTISGANASLVNNTLVSGGIAVRQTGGTGAVLRNNILVAAGASGFAIERTGGTMTSDYNLFDMRNGAWFGPAAGGLWEKLVYWQQQTGLDSNSVAASALFADEAGGDLHVKSVAGRWDGAGWVTDGEHSPAIDAGAPGDNVRDEPDGENGGRINIGAYGGTAEASKSRAGAWLQALTLNDGGVLRGTQVLRWNYGGMAATNRVLVQYSVNGGANWTTMATVAVTARASAWDSSATNSLDGAWRVVLEADAGVSDAVDRGMAIRNDDPREFYVSLDGSDSTGDGRSAGTAMATLTNVLATYDLEAGDAVRVGSGVYTSAAPVTVIWSRGGTNGNPVAITGSDDPAAPTVLRRATLAGEAMLVQASHVALEHLVFENAVNGLSLATNVSVSVDQVEARSNTVGIAIRSGGPHAVTSSRVRNNAQGGVLLSAATNATIANVTLANNGGYGVSVTGGTGLTLKNNIFYQGQDTAYAAYAGATSVVVSAGIDYNVYWFDPAVATGAVIYAGYPELGAWQRERLKDLRSEMIDPALQDVAGGDLHVKSEYGRYDAGTAAFVNDGETSWAIDRGDPYSSYVREPADANGRRINIGAYGNTAWASKSSATATGVTVETGAEFLDLDESENPYLVRWWLRDVDSVPSNLTYTIQFSGDGGVTWTHLRTGLSVFDEVYRWTNSPVFNTFKGKFRLQGEGTNSGVTATSEDVIWTFIGEHAFTGVAAEEGQPVRVIWRGAWGEEYRVFGTTNLMNTNAWTQLIATNLARGGDTVYTDTGATDRVFRVYRVLWSNTNDYPVP